MYKSIAVFCGSQAGNQLLFEAETVVLGKALAERNMHLVYGGGNVGLMGAVANSVLNNGGEVTGVMPHILKEQEHHHKGLTTLHVVENMHIRKQMMYNLCDAAITLPGGAGTMDELFELYTWNNLKIHHKPIFLLNIASFYNPLIEHLNHMQQSGFMYGSWQERIHVFNSVKEMLIFWDGDKKYNPL